MSGPSSGETMANGARVKSRYRSTLWSAAFGEMEKKSDPASEMVTRVSPAEHGALHQRQPADGLGLVEQVLPGLAGHVLELLDLGGHRHHANVRCAVTVHAYVLIQTDVGKAAQVAQQVTPSRAWWWPRA